MWLPSLPHGKRCVVCNHIPNADVRPRSPTCASAACRTEYRRRLSLQRGRRNCRFCGEAISLDGPDDACSDPLCREDLELWTAQVREESERNRRNWEVQEVAERQEAEWRERLGGELPANAVRALLPADRNPIAPQDPSRRDRLAQSLEALWRKASADSAPPVEEVAGVPAAAPRVEALSVAACGACRGVCCRKGADHAHLEEAAIRRYRRAHPDHTLEQMIDAYLSSVPPESVVDSCIYHSRTGCGLARELRSDACNNFWCSSQKELRASLPPDNPPPVLAILFDDARWARTALVDEKGMRILAEAPELPGDE